MFVLCAAGVARGADPPIAPSGASSAAAAIAPAPSSGHGAPASSASSAAAASGAGTVARLRDTRVFEIRAGAGGKTAEERAVAAGRALEAAAEEVELPEVRVEEDGETSVVFAGRTPIVQLTTEDADAAGDASRAVHAASVAAKVRAALGTEHQRHKAAQGVFSVSLAVFMGLLALLLLRKFGDLLDRARSWLAENQEKVPGLQVQNIDLISSRSLAGGLLLSLGAARLLGQLIILYLWVLFELSLFEPTRGYTAPFTRALVSPVTGLLQRLAGSVPLVIVAAVSLFALLLLLRFVGLFFQNVQRGDAAIAGLPRDLAPPTGLLAQGALIVLSLVIGIPLVTGSSEGALAGAGGMALGALALASTPLLATVVVGALQVYGRRLRAGDTAEIGGQSGTVTGLDLIETRLRDSEGREVRVPHLLALVYPTRLSRERGALRAEICVAAGQDQAAARHVLHEAAAALGAQPEVELRSIDAGGALYVVRCRAARGQERAPLLEALSDALARANIALGQPPRGER
jgi:small-conductance mechanosensitive channel